jgi:hypothetical protein
VQASEQTTQTLIEMKINLGCSLTGTSAYNESSSMALDNENQTK